MKSSRWPHCRVSPRADARSGTRPTLICSILIIFILTLALGAQAQSGMLYVKYHQEQHSILDTTAVADSATTKAHASTQLWFIADNYMRIEAPADSVNRLQYISIVAATDVWLFNKFTGQGQHMIDTTHAGKVHPVVFGSILTDELLKLEFGSELAYFKNHQPRQLKDIRIGGSVCEVHETVVDSMTLRLFVDKQSHFPRRVEVITPDGCTAIVYDKYEPNAPADMTLFQPPKDCTFIDRR